MHTWPVGVSTHCCVAVGLAAQASKTTLRSAGLAVIHISSMGKDRNVTNYAMAKLVAAREHPRLVAAKPVASKHTHGAPALAMRRARVYFRCIANEY